MNMRLVKRIPLTLLAMVTVVAGFILGLMSLSAGQEEYDFTEEPVVAVFIRRIAAETGEEDPDELTPGDIVFVVKELDEEKIVILPSAGFYRDIEDAPDEVPSYTLLRAENE